MVLTLPARGNFYIPARHKGSGGAVSFLLPHTARVGRTCEALAQKIVHYNLMCLKKLRLNSNSSINRGSHFHYKLVHKFF